MKKLKITREDWDEISSKTFDDQWGKGVPTKHKRPPDQLRGGI
jgi:hypothetical protein